MAGEGDLKELLAQKQELERAADGGAGDPQHGNALLAKLHAIDRISVGTLSFRWYDHPYPLYFRCGTSDLSNFVQIFINKEYEVPLPFAPRRIFDLGGYVGYAAAYLANKFPDAAIVSVEPSTDSFRMNTLNTGLFSNVRRLNAAVWESTGSLAVANSLGGDWGATFTKGSHSADDIPCYALSDLMKWANWDSFDFLKCDIEGSEREVFRQARDLIAANAKVCAVELHEGSAPGAEAAVHGCFAAGLFERSKHGEFHYFIRRDAAEAPVVARRIHVLKPAYGIRGIELINVPRQAWGYYIFQGDCCQLHPGEVRAQPAMLRTRLELSGQTNFDSELSVWNPLGYPVKFSAELNRIGGPRRIFACEQVVKAGERQRLRVQTEPLHGEFELTLATQMADGVPTNHQAVANWLHPAFY